MASSDPNGVIPGLKIPECKSELHEMAETVRDHDNDLHDCLVTIAHEVKGGLGKLGGNPALLGLDARLAARQVTRHFVKAAALHQQAAQAMIAGWHEYLRKFENQGTGGHARKFDPNK